MAIEFNRNGQLINAQLFKIDDVTFWDKTRPPIIDPRLDDEDYLVKDGDRLDLLAFQKLGDSRREWIIMRRNDLYLWPNSLVPGTFIKIPTITSLTERGII